MQGVEAEWELWRETGLGFPISHQMLESSECHEEAGDAVLVLGPNPTADSRMASMQDSVSPSGARKVDLPNLPWAGSSAGRRRHPWDEPFDEVAARETMRKLYDHYHKQVGWFPWHASSEHTAVRDATFVVPGSASPI